MLFNSLKFAVFLPVVFILYWLLPHRFRWILLLVSSYYFYMSWNPKYVVLILGTTIISFFAAKYIEKAESDKKKKAILAISAIICLGVLFVFKYLNFAIESVCGVLNMFSIPLQPVTVALILPVGISFYTFQTLSYVIDVYRGNVKAEKHFGYYATFVSFFPQLVAGPIERTSNLLPQISSEKSFDYDKATYGMKLMAWGFFKKMALADVLAPYVNKVFNDPFSYSGFSFVVAALFFSVQIYCDFSGYSDIAIGTAKLLGIDLMTNFKSPYFSQSIKEFWSRWHISLSTWFKDYVYIPLGGNRVSKFRNSLNLLITFLLSGMWHGADWTFIIWGGIHGFLQIGEKRLGMKPSENKFVRGIKTILVFFVCTVAWVFFRANGFGEAIYIITHSLSGVSNISWYIKSGLTDIGLNKSMLIGIAVCVLLLAVYDYISMKKDVIASLSKKNVVIRYICYFAILTMILYFRAGQEAEFVYFQF